MKPILLTLFAALVCRCADQAEVVRHVAAGPEDILNLNTGTFEYSSVVLPEGEKAVTYLCGDPKHWDVQIIEGAERFINIKPSPAAHATDIQVLTDHNHNFSIKAVLASPVDVKLFLDSTDVEALRKPPTFIPASEANRLKSEAAEAQTELQRQLEQNKKEQQNFADSYRASYPQKLTFNYEFERDKAPFFIHSVFSDDKFTYIAMSPEEVPGVYLLRDKKLDLVQADFANGVYTVRAIADRCELRVGKKHAVISRKGGN